MHNRRDLLKVVAGSAFGFAVGTGHTVRAESGASAKFPGSGTLWSEQLGWKLGCQAYSFNRYTFEEAVKKNVETGCRFIEAFPGQRLTKEGGNVGPGMNRDQKRLFRTILADHGCICTTFGVAGANEETLSWAAEMGIGVVNAEPGFGELPAIDKMCERIGVRVALHNHPKPSIYWDYRIVLEHTKDLSPRIGACVDTGHYMRSDINPIEAIRALKGRIIGFHFKDLNKYGGGAHDVPWGTGQGDVAAILRELREQKFTGCFSAEYEHNWESSVPEIAQSVEFFEKTAREIATA